MDVQGDNEDDLLGEIYQGPLESNLRDLGIRTAFRPWHKPRKQYIRLRQWCHHTKKLLSSRGIKSGELCYLGLPGEDMLDIRVMKDVCEQAGVQLKYLGFDNSLGSATVSLSQHEVNSSGFIHQASVVTRDRLEKLVDTRSVAYQYIDRAAPFDVINLDFCDALTTENGDTLPKLEAIRGLCDVQIKRQGQPWLLFVTARSIRSQTTNNTRALILTCLLDNLTINEEFAHVLATELNLDRAAIDAEILSGDQLPSAAWLKAYVLGISKWLLRYMTDHEYKVSVQMLPSFVYSVTDTEVDMMSLAFRFEPILVPRQDKTGLTKQRTIPNEVPSESDLALDLVRLVSDMINMYEMLSADPVMFRKMLDSSKAQLSKLRYDPDAYELFATTA